MQYFSDVLKDASIIFEKDDNGREILLYTANNVILTSESNKYPNILFKSMDDGNIFSPIKERTMSLGDNIPEPKINKSATNYFRRIEHTPVFYFGYNTDNYFHFVYDTLPYLITYKKALETNHNLKLLMLKPLIGETHYKFVVEFLDLLGINENDILTLEDGVIYTKMLISTSYTHDFDSNLPPRQEIYDLYADMVKKVTCNLPIRPKKIYVSRRTWIHGDNSNIGTNYTTRRKMMNEDKLVKYLTSIGYVEVFTELMTTSEKIALFSNVDKVIGAIGGGLCNVLFSNNNCELTAIISPTFMDVNKRFVYSFKDLKTNMFYDTSQVDTDKFKRNTRVKVGNRVGEIVEVFGLTAIVRFANDSVSGWNENDDFTILTVYLSDCKSLDDGLNSPWKVDIEKLKTLDL